MSNSRDEKHISDADVKKGSDCLRKLGFAPDKKQKENLESELDYGIKFNF